MALNPVVRRAIADRILPRHRPEQPGAATTEIVVRLGVEPERIRNIGGRERQINLTEREYRCLSPIEITLFSNKVFRRRVRLVVNRRRAYLLSVSSTGILVFTYGKFE